MSSNAATARRLWEEIFPSMDLDAVADVVAADSVDHSARPGEPGGIEGVRRTMQMLDAALSDQRFEVHQTIEDGDTVVVHFTHHGLFTGELMGMPPTGATVATPHIHILRFRDGLVVEHWGIHDHLAFMAQSRAMPPRPAPVG